CIAGKPTRHALEHHKWIHGVRIHSGYIFVPVCVFERHHAAEIRFSAEVANAFGLPEIAYLFGERRQPASERCTSRCPPTIHPEMFPNECLELDEDTQQTTHIVFQI